ncbi:MAG: hypothetical protein HYS12_23775 [Planctomycetes bacterium]|nr:hypothetical protein [Planctomycetota bacterium]
MARQTKKAWPPEWTPVVKSMGIEWLIEHVGAKKLIEYLGAKQVIEHLGVKRVIDELGGVKQLWGELTPEQRQQLKRLAQE